MFQNARHRSARTMHHLIASSQRIAQSQNHSEPQIGIWMDSNVQGARVIRGSSSDGR